MKSCRICLDLGKIIFISIIEIDSRLYYQLRIFLDMILTYKKDDDENEEGEAMDTIDESSNAAKRKAFFDKMIKKGLEIEHQKPQVTRNFTGLCLILYDHPLYFW